MGNQDQTILSLSHAAAMSVTTSMLVTDKGRERPPTFEIRIDIGLLLSTDKENSFDSFLLHGHQLGKNPTFF